MVTTTDDTVDADLDDGMALDANGDTSLRAAVMQANALGGDNEIDLPAGTFTLTLTRPAGPADTVYDLDVVRGDLVVRGAGENRTTIASEFGEVGGDTRLFELSAGATLALEGVTLSGGEVGTSGGAIFTDGGALTITDTTITGNTAINGTGGIDVRNGSAEFSRSTIDDNSGHSGGGIAIKK